MKAWDELTEAGRIRRLRPLAFAALDEFALDVVDLRLVGGFTNVVFRVATATGPRALRIDLEQEHADADVDVELAWLESLSADTDLDVTRPIRSRDGSLYVHAGAAGVPGNRRCTLFDWVPGRPLADRLSTDGYRRLGALSAGLHAHGAGFRPPHRPMAWDRVFYWPEEVDPVVIDLPEYRHHLGGDRREVLDLALAMATSAFSQLPANGAQIVHGDLHPWNVHVMRRRLIALDFEDVMWAHPVQDIAISLFYERDHAEYPALREAFEAGYRTVAPWPVSRPGELEHFMAARTLMFVNYMLHSSGEPEEFLQRAFDRLRAFVSTWG